MKAQILKIAGVKSEKEFYKKFPTEAAFMKKHGKELAKLKKAAVGDIIEYTDVDVGNNRKVIDGTELLKSVNKDVLSGFDQFKDRAYELGVDSLTTEDEKEDYEYKAKIDALYSNMNKKDDGGLLGGLQGLGGMLSKLSGDGPTGSVEVGDAEMIGMVAGKKGAKVEKFTPHMMYDPKTKKSKKAMTYKEHLALKKKGWGHNAPKSQFGLLLPGVHSEYAKMQKGKQKIKEDPASFARLLAGDPTAAAMFMKGGGKAPKAQFGFENIDFSSDNYTEDMNFGQKAGKFLSEDAGKILNSPMTKDVIMGISKIKGQKDALKDLKQMKEVSGIALQAAMTKPEEIEREYVRPEDIQNTGEEFFPIYGVGTNVLAKNGQTMNMFGNAGYAPLNNTSKVKRFQDGGNADVYGKIFDVGGDMLYGDKASRDAGSNIGGGVGRGIGTAIGGPLGGAIGDFVGSGIGDLVDRNDRRQRQTREEIDRNITTMNNMKIGPQIHAGYASHMKQGGRLPGPNNDYGMIGAPGPQVLKSFDGKNLSNMLQKASKMPDTLKEGGSVAGGGNVKTLWGGDVSAVAYNPYIGGDSMFFSGNSHDKKDPKTGQTGIGVAYGPQSIANNEAVVEVENEPAQLIEENGQENLVIYGDLKIPKEYSDEIGDPEAGGKKFKHYVNNLNDEEARINKQMGTAVENAGDTENTKWGKLVTSTSDAIINGGDMKLQNIANKKRILADLQEALNDTFKEKGIDGNKFISKGEIQAVKDTEDYAKNGGKMETYTDYAEDGTKIKKLKKIEKELHKASKMHKGQAERIGKMVNAKDGAGVPKAQNSETLELNELPVKFKTKEEAIEAGYEEFPEDSGKFRKVKIEATEEVEAVDATGTDIGEMPEGQKYDSKKGLAGNVTVAQYEEFVKANPWFDWENFDRRKKEDVKRFQREFNKRNKDAGIDVSLSVDGVVGEETVSARYSPPVEAAEAKDPQYEYAQIDEPVEEEVEEEEEGGGGLPFDASILRRLFPQRLDNDLDYNQILPEINAAANNQVDPVYAQSFQPRLRVPYDISLQDQRNMVNSQYRALSQNPALANNPAALAAAQAPFFDAINSIGAEEFRQNQAMKDTVYSGNLEAINNANMLNMGIYDKQQERQAQAVANTKETQQEIVKSISDKYQQNKLENRREKVLRELYPNFRFNNTLDLFNQGNAQFNIPGSGTTSPFGPYQNIFDYLTGGGFGGGQGTNTTDTTTTVAESAYGMKLTPIKKKVKRNQKNSNILRQFKK